MTTPPPLSTEMQRVMELAAIEAFTNRNPHITTRHILIAMLLEGTNDGADLLAQAGLTVEKLRRR